MADVADSTFFGYVRDALAHIHDRSRLQTHPLGALLLGTDRQESAESLHQILIEAIDQLRPLGLGPSHSPEWRRHRYLSLRYVEGLSPEQVARDLALSERQARRLHHDALNALVVLVWPGNDDLDRHASPESMTSRLDVPAEAAPTRTGDDHLAVEAELEWLEAGQGNARVSLGETLATVLQTIAPLIAQQATRITLSLPSDLPHVAVERTVLRQIFLLFLTHAVEEDARSVVRITAQESPSGQVVIDVAREYLAKDRSLGNGPDSVEIATGELVETSKRLVQMHGGTVESFAGSGGVRAFRITLPAIQPPTLLVVDDNPGVARLFRRYLQGTAYRVIEASTGPGAIRLAREIRPDVITLDVLLPSQDGWEILQQLRREKSTQSIPVVVCSILPERSLALALGVTDFLPKPVTRQSLLAVMQRCLTARQGASPGPL